MARQQLPRQIRKITVPDRRTGKPVTRYQVTTEAGRDPVSGRRRQTRKRFATEREARDHLAKVGTEVASGTYVARSVLTVDTALSEWLNGRHKLRASTIDGYRHMLAPVIAKYGTLPVQKLTKAHVDSLVHELRKGGAPKGKGTARPWGPRSVNLMLNVLAKALDSVIEQGDLVRNVARMVDHLPQERKAPTTLTGTEARTLLRATAGSRLHHAWTLALAGLRRGELCGLRWTDVDLTAGTVTVRSNRVLAGADIVENAPKTKTSGRTLPLTPGQVSALKAARKMQAAEKLALGADYGPGMHVLIDEVGQPMRPDALSAAWKRACKGAGVPTVNIHAARHTTASLMHLDGVPIATIAEWLGHRDASFTMATYAHHQPDGLALASASLSRVVTGSDSEAF